MTDALTCEACGKAFTLSDDVRGRYPGWTPKRCAACHRTSRGSGSGSRVSAEDELLTLDEVLGRYTDGPRSGVFTDGSCSPNPGPGGWGAVYVLDDVIQDAVYGDDPDTTNNRMELQALIAAVDLVPVGTAATVYTDSQLAVKTITEWAPGWERRGWKRRTGPIKNLDLVQILYAKFKERPELTLEWVKGHAGYRWNEYADALANTRRRDR